MASWAEHAIWWHVYPLGFTGAEKAALTMAGPVRHRLRQLDGVFNHVGRSFPAFRAAFAGGPGSPRRQVVPAVRHLTSEAIAFSAVGRAGILVLLNAGDTPFRFPVDLAGFPVDLAGFPVHLAGFPVHLAGFPVHLAGFPVDLAGFPVPQTHDPGARTGDPALVPAHSRVILGS